MWSTVLGILLIIGKILLIILLVILVLLLLILFVPFRYTVSADGKDKTVHGQACVSWLLRLVSVSLDFSKGDPAIPDGKRMTLRIFGISPAEVKRNLARKKKQKEREEKKEKIEKIKAEDPERYEEMKSRALQKKEEKEQEKIQKAEEAKARKEAEAAERAREEKRLERLKIYAKQRMGYMRRWIRAFSQSLRFAFAAVIFGIIELSRLPAALSVWIGRIASETAAFFDSLSQISWFLTDSRTGNALSHVKRKIGEILRHIWPGKLDGEITFGLGDPSTTGMALAAASAAWPLYGGSVRISPDFEEKRFDGAVTLKGRVRLITIVCILLTAFFNRNVLYVYRYYKKNKKMKEAS
ncbi:MAG: DUF2953 domain-containing protein [Lachnospiraceae bacterium]|nr:DUF2953 domain-containing protein [Lachnospiraceae bacterium]